MSLVQSVERAFTILSVLSGEAMPLTAIAAQTMLPKSTVARLLTTLEALGAVEREDDGWNYRVGPAIAEMARATDLDARLVSMVTPHLKNLTMAVGEATGFAVLEGYRVRFIAHVESPTPVQIRDYTGTVCPAHVGPSGLCMMTAWPAEELSRYLERPLGAFTPSTVTDPEEIRKRLEQIEEDGYLWIHDEFAEGISSVAAPVQDTDGVMVGAVHAHGPSYRFPAFGQAEGIGEVVRDAAAYIRIGGRA
ncbi:IclR family transcriptional regulator [Euzebya tangerina]|uniref:IclR family transcriptional regulator n=1 Tax=Euzebya tangerina TaxID=591198 RepID=UPI000E316512|nr:IclR family transcriptional regulator [Euzebya tangerina]